MSAGSRGPTRVTTLLWAAMAEAVLGGLLFALLAIFDADDPLPLGSRAWVAATVAAMLVTGVGVLVLALPGRRPPAIRWSVALLVAGIAGIVGLLMITAFVSGDGSVAGLAIPMVVVIVGMSVVAAGAATADSGRGAG